MLGRPDRWFETSDRRTAIEECLTACHALPECDAYATSCRPNFGVWAGVDRVPEGRRMTDHVARVKGSRGRGLRSRAAKALKRERSLKNTAAVRYRAGHRQETPE